MKKKFRLIFALLLTSCVGIGLILFSKTVYVARPSSRAPQPQTQLFQTPYHRLNSAARAAKDGSDSSIDALADAVITDFIPLTLPSDSRDAIRARLVRAEQSYRRGGRAVSEMDIVRTVNDLTDKFAAPEYTKTNSAQVRSLRGTMVGLLPHLIIQGQGTEKGGPMEQHLSMNPKMSPVEGVFLTAMLLQQKVLNEDFQVERQDWQNYKHNKNVERWQSLHERKKEMDGRASSAQLTLRARNPKSEEINGLIQRNSDMSDSDLANLVNHSLDMLGISR